MRARWPQTPTAALICTFKTKNNGCRLHLIIWGRLRVATFAPPVPPLPLTTLSTPRRDETLAVSPRGRRSPDFADYRGTGAPYIHNLLDGTSNDRNTHAWSGQTTRAGQPVDRRMFKLRYPLGGIGAQPTCRKKGTRRKYFQRVRFFCQLAFPVKTSATERQNAE